MDVFWLLMVISLAAVPLADLAQGQARRQRAGWPLTELPSASEDLPPPAALESISLLHRGSLGSAPRRVLAVSREGSPDIAIGRGH